MHNLEYKWLWQGLVTKNSLNLLISHLFTHVELLFSYLGIMDKSISKHTLTHAGVCVHTQTHTYTVLGIMELSLCLADKA